MIESIRGGTVISLHDARAPTRAGDHSPATRQETAPLIALVDRRELTRHGLERWLEEGWPGHQVVAVPRVADLGERARRGLRFAVIGVLYRPRLVGHRTGA